jgi:hypothetical protein
VGYRNPIITLRFPDLVDDGDNCHVVIRNPQLIPGEKYAAMGMREDGEADDQKMHRMFGLIADLVVGWRVWDPTVPVKADESGNLIEDDETAPRLLPLPATPALVAKLPQEILTKLMEKMTSVFPQQTPADGTSKTS